MNRLLVPFRQSHGTKPFRFALTLAACICMTFAEVSASAQLADNQTNGFGNSRLVTFTYFRENYRQLFRNKLLRLFWGDKVCRPR